MPMLFVRYHKRIARWVASILYPVQGRNEINTFGKSQWFK